MELTVIITAGGIGQRMGADLPKQFLPVCGIPILQRTIQKFHDFNANAQLLLTLPEEWLDYWKNLCKEHSFSTPHQVISGGKERYDSVKKALSHAAGEIVLVHDGVRPFVSEDVITRVLASVDDQTAVVPAIPFTSSVRKGTQTKNVAVDRSTLWSVQTPQGFTKNVITRAYRQPFSREITDDASLVEKLGVSTTIVEGDVKNIKITTPLDLSIAESILDC